MTVGHDPSVRLMTPVLGGRAIVYFVSTDGNYARAIGLLNEEDQRTVSIPNGSYKVYAIGWVDPMDPMDSQAKCDTANGGNPITFGGGEKVIQFDLSVAKCQFGTTTHFGNGTDHATGNFRNVEVYICNAGPTDGCPGNNLSGYSTRIFLYEYERNGNSYSIDKNNSLRSVCADFSASNNVTLIGYPPPGADHALAVAVFSGASCPGNPVRTYEFLKGMSNASATLGAGIALKTLVSSTTLRLNLFQDF